jgi:hypothetical protein
MNRIKNPAYNVFRKGGRVKMGEKTKKTLPEPYLFIDRPEFSRTLLPLQRTFRTPLEEEEEAFAGASPFAEDGREREGGRADSAEGTDEEKQKEIARKIRSLLYPPVLPRPFCTVLIDGKRVRCQILNKQVDRVRLKIENELLEVPIKEIQDLFLD